MKHKTIRKITPVPRPGLLVGMLMPRILPLHPCADARLWMWNNALMPVYVAIQQRELVEWLRWLSDRLFLYLQEDPMDALMKYSVAVDNARRERAEAASVVTQAFWLKSRNMWWVESARYGLPADASFKARTAAYQRYNESYMSLHNQFDADIAVLNAQMEATIQRAWRRCAARIYPLLVEALFARRMS